MYEELKAWADKWNIVYTEENYNGELCIRFDGEIFTDATYGKGKISFEYNSKTGGYEWSGDMC